VTPQIANPKRTPPPTLPSSGGAKGNDERDQTLNQMLSEMDGFDNDSSVSG